MFFIWMYVSVQEKHVITDGVLDLWSLFILSLQCVS